jgi:hypothetical protein
MKTIIPERTPEIAELAFVRTPFKAATEKRVTPKGTMLQVGEKPPNAPCQIVFIGASHTQCGMSPRITIGIRNQPMD